MAWAQASTHSHGHACIGAVYRSCMKALSRALDSGSYPAVAVVAAQRADARALVGVAVEGWRNSVCPRRQHTDGRCQRQQRRRYPGGAGPAGGPREASPPYRRPIQLHARQASQPRGRPRSSTHAQRREEPGNPGWLAGARAGEGLASRAPPPLGWAGGAGCAAGGRSGAAPCRRLALAGQHTGRVRLCASRDEAFVTQHHLRDVTMVVDGGAVRRLRQDRHLPALPEKHVWAEWRPPGRAPPRHTGRLTRLPLPCFRCQRCGVGRNHPNVCVCNSHGAAAPERRPCPGTMEAERRV